MSKTPAILDPIGKNGDTFHPIFKILLNGSDSVIDRRFKTKVDMKQGDCFKLIKELEDSSIDMIITDPPYFIDQFQCDWDTDYIEERTSKGKTVKNLPVGMKFDPKQGKRFGEFFYRFSKEAFRVLKPGGFFISFSQGRLYHRMAVASEDNGFLIKDMMVWHYTKQAQPKAFTMKHFILKKLAKGLIDKKEADRLLKKVGERKTPQLRPLLEPMMLSQKPLDGTFVENWDKWGTGLIDTSIRLDGRFPSNVLQIEKPAKDEYNNHPTVKPIELMEHMIRVFTKEGDTILDPFMGSGSTAISCLRSERNIIGYELDGKYFKIAEKRVKQEKGEK